MKRAIIIHCWEGYPDYCWYPQTKKELEAKGFKVDVPLMPHTKNPKLTEWLPHLKKIIGKLDEDLYLIGHSLGNPTIFRYLESLKGKKMIGARIKKKMTQEELAKKVGTGQAVISRLEGMNARPSITLLKRISGALETPIKITIKPSS